MENMDLKRKNNYPPLTPNDKDDSRPNNDYAPTWEVNLNYITNEDLNSIYGYVPESDELPDNPQLSNLTKASIGIASERVNSLSGNLIESIGFDNLNETQQNLVKRATAKMAIYWLKNGIDYIRSSVSLSGNGISYSVTPPSEPQYIIEETFDLLQQANLYVVRKGVSESYCKQQVPWYDNSPVDLGDRTSPTWVDSFRTFLTPNSIESDGTINIKDTSSGTKARVELSINPSSEITKEYVDNQDKATLEEAKSFSKALDETTNKNLSEAINLKANKDDIIWFYDDFWTRLKKPSHINMTGYKINGLDDGFEPYDAVNKNQLDTKQNKVFNDEEANRLKLVLENLAFGYNKNKSGTPLEHKGFFTQMTIFNDLDKPADNIITDEQGNPLEIRKVTDSHYSGNTWFDETGNTSLRDYQDKLTYKDKDIGSGSSGSSYIEGEFKYTSINVVTMPTGWKKLSSSWKNTILVSEYEKTPPTTVNYDLFSGENNTRKIALSFNSPNSVTNLVKLTTPEGTNEFLTCIESVLWQYDPNNKYSDLKDKIYIGDEDWRNFRTTRLQEEN